MALDPHQILQQGAQPDTTELAPLAGTRRQRLQRLQIGLFGLGSVVLLIGLANIIISSARQNEAVAPDDLPAATSGDVPDPGPRDPLADVGVAPDLPIDGQDTTGTGDMPPPQAAPAGEALGNDPLADPAN